MLNWFLPIINELAGIPGLHNCVWLAVQVNGIPELYFGESGSKEFGSIGAVMA
jgi:hypothetical protein